MIMSTMTKQPETAKKVVLVEEESDRGGRSGIRRYRLARMRVKASPVTLTAYKSALLTK